jgi:hypothetical protein
MVFYNYFLHTSLFCFLLRIKYPKTKRLNWNHHLAKKNDKPLSFSNREWVILDEVPTMVEIEIFWFQIHITNGLNSLHRKQHTGNQYRVKSAENRMRSNLERFADSMSARTFCNSYPTNSYTISSYECLKMTQNRSVF